FVVTGIDDAAKEAIGDLPRGRGILGVLIRDATPLRLDDLSPDPRSVGFPPNHPPMRTFLGVPILLRGVAYGNLYLTEKAGGSPFSEEDQEIVQLLAGQAAVGIENARLYESATRWLDQLQPLTDFGKALRGGAELPGSAPASGSTRCGRRQPGCWSGAGASESTRCSRILRSIRERREEWGRETACGSR